LQDPPVEAASVDLVILSQALHHAENPAAALRSAHKLLKAGGQILILDLLKHRFEGAQSFTATAGRALPKAICTAGWRRPASKKSRSASWPARISRRISRPCWPAAKNNPVRNGTLRRPYRHGCLSQA
jgi:ubiquinone/menaquinone biosynthesis C-methylase UbiE